MINLAATKQDELRRADLRKIPVPVRPECSDRWKPVQHGDLADSIVTTLRKRGAEVLKERWTLTPNQQGLVGTVNLRLPEDLGIPSLDGMEYSLGAIHSNDGRHALKFVAGTQIFICTNGMVVGDFVVSRKHTTGVSLDNVVDSGLDRYFETLRNTNNVIDGMKGLELNQERADNLLMEAGRNRLLSWSHIGKVADEYAKPTFEAFNERTGWGLYNAFTYVAQKSSAEKQLSAITGFRNLTLDAAA